MEPRAIDFSKDGLGHPAVIEWWYWNGHLQDDRRAEYAFMYCVFKVDPKRVNIPFMQRIPVPDLYFSHFLVSDIGKKQSESGTHFFREMRNYEDAAPLLYLESRDGFLVQEREPFSYALKTPQLNMELIAQKSPMLVNGNGWVPVKSSGTFYYSLPRLRASGTLRVKGEAIPVRGIAWMDHQWSDEPASAEDKWNWFSLQFDDGTEMLCCEYGDKTKIQFATMSDARGEQRTTHNMKLLLADDCWISAKTGARYPMAWTIELPEWKMRMQITPKLREQEMLFGTMNYWEGPVRVSGTREGASISGDGFMELVGVPMGTSAAELVLHEAEAHIAEYIKRVL